MKYKAPGQCPVCGEELAITKLTCHHCRSSLEGEFTSCKFCQLPPEQLEFIEVFVKCRGSIKDVEKELGISYPTVRNKLDMVIQALGYKVDRVDAEDGKEQRQEILDALQRGELTPQEAAQRLRKGNR